MQIKHHKLFRLYGKVKVIPNFFQTFKMEEFSIIHYNAKNCYETIILNPVFHRGELCVLNLNEYKMFILS